MLQAIHETIPSLSPKKRNSIYNHQMKPSITATRPAPMPAISLPGLAMPVWLADAAVPVPEAALLELPPPLRLVLAAPLLPLIPAVAVPLEAAVPAVMEEATCALYVWPKVGRATLPLTAQSDDV